MKKQPSKVVNDAYVKSKDEYLKKCELIKNPVQRKLLSHIIAMTKAIQVSKEPCFVISNMEK